jgi:enoyl-CoA hydratase
MADDGTLVHYEAENGIALLTLDDPPANTYTHEMMKELDAAVLRGRMDDDVHVIVLTGAGEKFFSAGANIQMLSEVTTGFKYCFCLHANETLLRLEHTPKLTIAALNGHTVGGGLEIAMACDLIIAREGGGQIGLPEVNLGVLPGTGGTQRLSRLVGKAKALELMVTGETFGFDRAVELGIVNRAISAQGAEEFMEKVMEFAASFTTPNRATKAVGHIKRSVQSGSMLPLEQGLTLERELQQQLFASDDAREGLTAYVEKRKPDFKGK